MRHIKSSTPSLRGVLIAGAALTLTACASGASYMPIVDGPQDAKYSADLGDCSQLAKTRNYVNGDSKTSALLGAGLGGLLGLADDDGGSTGDVIGGAVIGAILGGGKQVFKARTQRKKIVINCMAGRGHRVVG